MVASVAIFDAFEDLGYDIDNPEVVEKLRHLCDQHKVDENEISANYLLFASKKKYQAPTLAILDKFEYWIGVFDKEDPN